MNGAQLHLLVNHVPVFVPFIGACILAYGLARRSREIESLALGILVLGALGSLLAYFSGAPAEEVVKNYPEINRPAIETHESYALAALIAVEISGTAAVAAAFLRRRSPVPRIWLAALVTFTIGSSILVMWTAHLGGLIRHEELERR